MQARQKCALGKITEAVTQLRYLTDNSVIMYYYNVIPFIRNTGMLVFKEQPC